MSTAGEPGDFLIKSITLANRPVTHGFISGSIYESVFTPCVVAELNFRDNDDALFATLNLSGGEPLDITFQVPGRESVTYKFLINKPENLAPSSLYKSRTMRLVCMSEEAFYAAGGVDVNGYVQKSYKDKLISYAVKDILTSYLKTKKDMYIEQTKTAQHIIAQDEKVWYFIDRIRRRAISSYNESSSYVFFENRDGFFFVTLESLFEKDVIKKFVQDNTVGSDIMKLMHNNVIGYELPYIFNSVDRIDRGTMKSRYTTFNYQTNEYTKKTVTTPDKGDTYGGENDWNTNSFVAKFGKYPGRNSHLPYDNKIPITNIPETTPNQLAYSGNLLQNTIRLRVFGDTILKAGELIEATINRQGAFENKDDSDMSGKMLIASLRHMFNPEGERPRYTCILECLKGRPK